MATRGDCVSVLFPVNCLRCESGVLVGWKGSVTNNFLVVVSVISLNELKELDTKNPLEKLNLEDGRHDLSLLGVWCAAPGHHRELGAVVWRLFKSKNEEYVVLRKKDSSARPALYCEGLSRDVNAMLIVYNKPKGRYVLTVDSVDLGLGGNRAPTEIESGGDATSHLQEIVFLLNASEEAESFINLFLKCMNTDRQNSIVTFLSSYIVSLLGMIVFAVDHVGLVFASVGRRKIFKFQVVKFAFSSLTVLRQFSWRMQQIRSLQDYMSGAVDIKSKEENTGNNTDVSSVANQVKHLGSITSSSSLNSTRQARVISYGNLVCSVLLDVFLGVLVVGCLYYCDITTSMSDVIMKTTHSVADDLSALINWMMGVPAGLKLNKQFAYLLGQFFLYHIFLWKTYLAFMEPYVQSIVWCSILPGCCGLSFLLSLASDVLSLLTLHIYCFYVYAARIYSSQVHYLVLLGRHFTGKRWNAQTSQVERVPYKIDQLFIGTMIFTILLFLLPTTGLFYFVFTLLRSLVLVLKGVLSCAIRGINHLPVFAMYMALFKPGSLAGGLQFEVVKPPVSKDVLFLDSIELQCCSRVLHLNMTNRPLLLNKLFIWPVFPSTQGRLNTDDHYSWRLLTKKLVLGQLIYPWIKKDQ